MNGKSKCKILKEIRREIARNNDIAFVTSECTYQGDCTGTCPKCEAELRYLEQELEKRRRTGKAVAVAGIAAAMVVTATGCSVDHLFPQEGPPMGSYPAGNTSIETREVISTPGAPIEPDVPEIEQPLQGDIAYVPEPEPVLFPGEVPAPN